jgi:1-deoxy-D-xylulose-5-phosphate reductoisomerase
MLGERKRLAVLGSTGSVGRSVLAVAAAHPDVFEVVSLSALRSVGLLSEQARKFGVRRVAIGSGASSDAFPPGVDVLTGRDALEELAGDPDVDLVVNALVGASGLRPTVAAVGAGKRLALANKESLVAAGEFVMGLAEETGSEILPVDSEHSSVFRCVRGTPSAEIDAVVLTASGGPLRDLPPEDVAGASVEQVLAHPTWEMGQKITIDSASLVNKAMEVIEAHWLFGLPFEKIEVVVHRESVVHSLVRLSDGSLLAHLCEPDMRIPIQYAMFYPEAPADAFSGRGLVELGALHFEPVDLGRYPCFQLIVRAGREGGTAPAVAAAADEVAVAAFAAGAVAFDAIPRIIAATLEAVPSSPAGDLGAVLDAESAAREAAEREVSVLVGKDWTVG